MKFTDLDFLLSILIYGGGSFIIFYGIVYIFIGYLYYIYRKNQAEIELEGLLFRSTVYTATAVIFITFIIILFMFVVQSSYIAEGIYYFYNYNWDNPNIYSKLADAFTDPSLLQEAKTIVTMTVILYTAYTFSIIVSVFLMFGVFSVTIHKCRKQEDGDALISIECLMSKGFLSVMFVFFFILMLSLVSGLLAFIIKSSNTLNITNISLSDMSFNFLTILQQYMKEALDIVKNTKGV